jgi:hypothetical protein
MTICHRLILDIIEYSLNFPSSDNNLNCPIFSEGSKPSNISLVFKSFQYFLDPLDSVNDISGKMLEINRIRKNHFTNFKNSSLEICKSCLIILFINPLSKSSVG